MKDILLIEPFCGGSHGQLVQLLTADPVLGSRCELYSLPAKKWHWRARTSALYFSQVLQDCSSYRFLFTSSVLNLAELVALRPEIAGLKKIVYFHENQLVYPVRKKLDRDFQYGYNQILTSMVADVVIFNSKFNMESFLSSISSHLKLIPDHRPKDLESCIKQKCKVIYFPITFKTFDGPEDTHWDVVHSGTRCTKDRALDTQSDLVGSGSRDAGDGYQELEEQNGVPFDVPQHCTVDESSQETSPQTFQMEQKREMTLLPKECLHIVWPHRWEHDKDPESFFAALFELAEEGHTFAVSVLGESFSEVPDIFHSAKERLGDRIYAWGFQTKDAYHRILNAAHVVVSTAQHEFFGVSMLEGVSQGCYPLCPKRLVYPEIYPEECLYSTQNQLVKRLRRFCQRAPVDSRDKFKSLVDQFSWEKLQGNFQELFKT